MNKISKAAGLSRIYSNHCIRATAVTVLSNSGVDANDIICVSGHKNVQSLLPYQQSVSDVKRKSMSGALASFGKENSVPSEKTPQKDVQVLAQTNSQALSNSVLQGNNFHAGTITVNVNVRNH